ncbi:DUF1631 family protein [Lysobacter sp. F6437]|uniref:DUF1631 family protein n=1 Tax=Lysobacter sp. F6437 TaxID=3459296 RepID=UPI00403D8795
MSDHHVPSQATRRGAGPAGGIDPVAPLRQSPAMVALPPRVRHLLGQLLGLLSTQLTRELDRLLMTLEHDLFRQAEFARNPALQSGYLETVKTLRKHRDEFIPFFMGELEDALVAIRDPASRPPAPTETEAPRFDAMRLVEDSEVSEDAVLSAIALRHESRAGLPLLLLGQRFGVLAGAPAFDAAALPVGPQSLGRLLARACTRLQLNLDARLQLYQLYDRQLMAGYAMLVESMNDLLDGANVLPGLTFVPLRTRRNDKRGATPVDSDPARAGTGAAAADPGPDAPQDSFAGSASDPAEAETLALLRQLMAERRDLLDKLATSPTRARVALPTVDVDAALGALQARAPNPQSPSTVPDIRQALLAQSRLKLGEAATLSREDSDTFELLGMLYTEIGRELRAGTQSKALLEQLQVPLLRVALQDRAFFVRQQHPARQLLNAVAEAGAVWLAEDEADPQLNAKLQSAVDHVVTHYDGDAAVFDSANQQLQEHLQVMVRKAEVSERRHVDAAQGREKLDLAKRQATEVIEDAAGGRTIPRFLGGLLDQAWSDVLTLVLLRHGEASGEWQQHVGATRQIIAACVDGVPAPDGLADRIEKALALVGYHGEEAAAITRRLTAADDDSDDPASRTELAMKLKARARLGADTAEKPKVAAAPRTPREQACHDHLRTLPFGSWIEFSINQQGDVVRRRLAWYSPVTGRALFVNQRGQRIDDATGPQDLDQLARLVAIGQARVVPAGHARLVDRAWQAAVTALRGITGHAQGQEQSA